MKKITTLIALGFFGGLLLGRPVSAVTVTEHTVELFAKPGDKFERTMQLYDDSLQGVKVYTSVGNFKENPNQPGSAVLITDPAELKPDRDYVKLSVDSLELPKEGGLTPFDYKIEVPADAAPGTHLLSIVFTTQPPPAPDSGSSVTIGTNVLTNIFLKVGGATVDSIETNFEVGSYTSTDPKQRPDEKPRTFKIKHFFLKPPAEFLVEVHNTGNTHQKPDGNIKIQNDLFGKSYEKILVNSDSKIVLPGGTRVYPVDSFGKGLMLGKYRAKLTLIYGDPLRDQTREVVFWIVPLVEIAIALGIIILLIIIIKIIRHYDKKRRERKERLKEEELRKTLREEIQRSIHDATEKEKPAEPAKPIESLTMPAAPVVPPPAPLPVPPPPPPKPDNDPSSSPPHISN